MNIWIYVIIGVVIVGLIGWLLMKKKNGPDDEVSAPPSEPPVNPPQMPGM